MKPENILIDSKGYIKLTDFGLSTIGIDKTKSICGTLEYLAPEVLFGHYYGRHVDYWALGCLLFEMSFGFPPFRSQRLTSLKKLIVDGKFHIPSEPPISASLKNLIKSLLIIDP